MIKQVIIKAGAILLICLGALAVLFIVGWFFGSGRIPAGVIQSQRTFFLSCLIAGLLLVALGVLSLRYGKKYEPVLCNLYLVVLSFMILGPVAAESYFRIGIMTSKKFRNPGLYTDCYADDNYWKLYDLWNIKYRAPRPERVHPVLGKVNRKETEENPLGIIRKTPYDPDYGPNTILFFGDSFVVGATPLKDKIPRILEKLLPGVTVYNYGGSGYGVDQIFLRFELAHKRFQQPVIIVGILSNDVDRCVLSVRVGQKPYFKVEDNKLVLCGTPIQPDQSEWYRKHPPDVYSFASAFLMRKFRTFMEGGDPYELRYKREEKKLICGKIIEDLVEKTRTQNLPLLLVFFYGERELSYRGWREVFLEEQATKWHVPHVDTKEVLLKASQESGIPVGDFYIRGDGHPSPRANQLIAEAIVDRLRPIMGDRLQTQPRTDLKNTLEARRIGENGVME